MDVQKFICWFSVQKLWHIHACVYVQSPEWLLSECVHWKDCLAPQIASVDCSCRLFALLLFSYVAIPQFYCFLPLCFLDFLVYKLEAQETLNKGRVSKQMMSLDKDLRDVDSKIHSWGWACCVLGLIIILKHWDFFLKRKKEMQAAIIIAGGGKNFGKMKWWEAQSCPP